MAFAKFRENRFRIDGEIAENHAILVNLTASIKDGQIHNSYTNSKDGRPFFYFSARDLKFCSHKVHYIHD